MSECRYPGCGLDVGARPYARSGIASVTTVIDLANFDDKARRFAWAAGERSATKAVHHTAEWWDMPAHTKAGPCTEDHKVEPGLCPACKYLRSQFDWQTREKAALGNHVHHLAASWAKGDDVESDEVTDPFLDGLEQWYKDVHPKFVAVEQTVHYLAGVRQYVGTFDLLVSHDCTCPCANEDQRCTSLLDIKTGIGQWDKEWLLQLSAYRYAKSRTSWEKGKQTILGPMPVVGHTGVLWLHDDGRAEVVPVHTDAEAFNHFLRLLDLYGWQKRVDKELAELKEKSDATV
jgi:hypothetical protein